MGLKVERGENMNGSTLKNYRAIFKELVEILDELIELEEKQEEITDKKRYEELQGRFLFKMTELQNVN